MIEFEDAEILFATVYTFLCHQIFGNSSTKELSILALADEASFVVRVSISSVVIPTVLPLALVTVAVSSARLAIADGKLRVRQDHFTNSACLHATSVA